MHRLPPVEEARAIMTEAQNWSIWKWLTQKPKVRAIADKATQTLKEAIESAKDSWSDDMNRAYNEVLAEAAVDGSAPSKRKLANAKKDAQDVDPKIKTAARKAREAEHEGYRATMDAEDLFAESERRLSASMARQAAKKALESYDLREAAIRKAEAAAALQ
jgi:hypothetical protein